MRRIWSLVWTLAVPALHAETYTLSLKQAIDRALAQNPDVIMARMDEAKSMAAVQLARDPFTPRIGFGSGLAYSNGFPLSIEGSAPAAVQGRANQYLFNRPQTYAIAQARENARAAGFATGERRDEVAFRVAALYVDTDRSGRLADAARRQVENLHKVFETADARVKLGRELAIVSQEANVNLLKARQRLASYDADREYAEHNLAATLGFNATDSVKPVEEERRVAPAPANEEEALTEALASSKELRRLESNYEAKALEIKGSRAQKLPRVDLVAQYALLTRYSNYDEYFRKFQRNNGQIGASIQLPILPGPGVKAAVTQAESDRQHLRAEMQAARSRIALGVHQSYQDIERARVATEVAQADLDLARSQLSVLLAQMNEGRATLRQVEEARFNENEKWIAFYDAQFNAEKAKLGLLRNTGGLMAALQ